MKSDQDEIPKIADGLRLQEILKKKPYLELLFRKDPQESCSSLNLYYTTNEAGEVCIEYSELIAPSQRKPLCSRRNPLTEASRIVPEWKLKGTEIIIIQGLGNPYVLTEILKIRRPGQITIVMECCPELIRLYMADGFEPLLSFLETAGCHLFAGEGMLTAYKTYLDTIPPERISGIRVASHSPSVRLCPEFYGELLRFASAVISSRISDMMTRFEFERLWMKNIILNSLYYLDKLKEESSLHCNGTARAADPFAEFRIPGVLISAGPSLKESLPLLRKIQDHALLLAVDTSLKVLLRNGITPHAVFTLDAQKHSLFHFLGEDLKGITLFADIVADPSLLRTVNPDCTVFTVTARYIQDAAGNERREVTPGAEFFEQFSDSLISLQSGGSVATSAFDLLRNLGVCEIWFVGQDLAYTGRKIHATGTHHNEKWLPSLNRLRSLESINEQIIRRRDTAWTRSLRGEIILTDFVLNLYRSWFEESVTEIGIPVINLSADGAFMKGAYHPPDPSAYVENFIKKSYNHASLHREDLRKAVSAYFRSLAFPDPAVRERAENIIISTINNLYKLLSDFLNDEVGPETLTAAYPWTEKAARRALVYSSRHKDALSEEKRRRLYTDALKKEMKEIMRTLTKIMFRLRHHHPEQSEE